MIDLIPIITPLDERNHADWPDADESGRAPVAPGSPECRDSRGQGRPIYRATLGIDRLEAPFEAIGPEGLPIDAASLDLPTARTIARLASRAAPSNWKRIRKTAFEPSFPDSLPMRLALSAYDGGHLHRLERKGTSWSILFGQQVVTAVPTTGLESFPSFGLLLADLRHGALVGYDGAPDRAASLEEIDERWKNSVYIGLGVRAFPADASAHQALLLRQQALTEIRTILSSVMERGLWRSRHVAEPIIHRTLAWTAEGVPVGRTGESFWSRHAAVYLSEDDEDDDA